MILKKFINLFFLFFLFFFNFNLFSKNDIKIDKIKLLSEVICDPVFSSVKTILDKFLLFKIEDVNNLTNIINFEVDLKDENNNSFSIEGKDEKKHEYKIDKNIETDKNKKFELKLDLNNEKIEIQEITDYDNLNKKNILSNNVFIFDFKDFTCVIFKVTYKVKKKMRKNINGIVQEVEKEVDEDKYIFCNDCNTYKVGNSAKDEENSYYGMFSTPNNELNYYKVSVAWISKNKTKWTNIKKMFSENNFIEEVDFGNFDYKFEDISQCFSECKNLKNVKNLKKLFNDNLKDASFFFNTSQNIDNVDISNVKLPEDSSGFFCDCSIKNLKYDNLDCSKCKNLEYFLAGNEIEEFDFNKLKNTENIEKLSMFFSNCENLKKVIFKDIKFPKLINISQMFNNCKKLYEIIGFENISFQLQQSFYIFTLCKSLKKLNLSNLKLNDNSKNIVDFRYIKDLILPNDQNSAKLIINDIKEFFNRTYGKNLDNKFNIYYKNQKLENVSKFDDLDKFIDNPADYIDKGNREKVLKVNEQKYSDSLKNLDKIDENSLKTLGCCSKNCCCCGG